jgi:arylsulfatase A-like enzyme
MIGWVKKMKTSLSVSLWCIMLLLMGCAQPPVATNPPNVIIILADDLGYADVGFNGCQDIPTPNIDRIAQQGVTFTNGYVTYPVCGPSRAGLITGRYQDRFGFGRNPLFAPKDSTQGVPTSEQMLSELLQPAGYTTMAVGKWHLGAHESLRPQNRGFDQFFGFLTGGHRYFPDEWTLQDISEVNAQFAAYRTKLLHNGQRVDETEYLTDALSREAVSFVEENGEAPFFLYLAYNAPHAPLQATDEYLDRFAQIKDKKRRVYAAMVSAMDDGIGLILDQLETSGIEENTLVFFLSDNGGPEAKNGSDNGPLREGKGSLYEGGIRVPFAVQWPGTIPAGVTYDPAVSSLDIFAMAATVSGTQPKNQLDGVDLLPFLNGSREGQPHPNLFWRKFDQDAQAMRLGNLKYVRAPKDADGYYNLADALSEEQVYAVSPDQQDAFRQTYARWETQLQPPAFLGLMQNQEYNEAHPDRFTDVEKY